MVQVQYHKLIIICPDLHVHKISNNNQSSTTTPENGNDDFNLTPNINNINKSDTVKTEDTHSQAPYKILHQTEINNQNGKDLTITIINPQI